ncbi:holo-ACP synthase [Elusimicrobiota bacterium]
MRIIGTGVDIIEIKRVRALAKREPKFLSRVFSKEELLYSMRSKKRWEHLAVRFAAKEALWKALGKDGVPLSAISVKRDNRGKPTMNLKNLGVPRSWQASISLSHSREYAVAYCIVYSK